jgi:hypothetical protein
MAAASIRGRNRASQPRAARSPGPERCPLPPVGPHLNEYAEETMAFENEPKTTDSYGELGAGLEPSPTKAAIALAVMIVLGVVLYQVSKTTDTQTSLATPSVTQDVANNKR